ncbi:hypothetical protein C0992_004846 [Termitomyces sp. T32_za158]|nr:hypothetical protein C0992_004846 [Termitomyces sp. T32_za158]
MLRVAADCDEIPSSVISVVRELGHQSKRHLRQVRLIFEAMIKTLTVTLAVRTIYIPHWQQGQPHGGSTEGPVFLHPTVPSKLSSSQSLSASKLRYDAYEAPIPAPKLRDRDISSSPLPPETTQQWDVSSDTGIESLNLVSPRLPASSPDPPSNPLTAGELTLAASRRELGVIPEGQRKVKGKTFWGFGKPILSHLSRGDSNKKQRADLISLDAPFVTGPKEITKDFMSLWDSMEDGDARGWFSGSVDVVVERIRSLEIRLQVFPVDDLPYRGMGF